MPEPTPVLPEVLAQIRTLPPSQNRLIVCDVDEVILHMIRHLEDYLAARSLSFLKHEYKFTGNIVSVADGSVLSADAVRAHLNRFFDEVSADQDMVAGADTALNSLAGAWDIVFLTNLPGGHNKPVREQLLASLGLSYPVLTNRGPKGGAVAALAAGRSGPLVFIDDSPVNHVSVMASMPDACQIQFIADDRFRNAVPPEAHIDLLTGDWQETAHFISAIL